jgi:two-component system chemotaxis response regulator CheY
MKNVWIVDDDEEMSRAISLMLKLLDCESRMFLNARSTAEALLAGERPDLLVLDINMPEVSGMDLLEFLRRDPEWVELPIIMLSSEVTDIQVDAAMERGADGYVFKPVTIEELEKVMTRAFQKHKNKWKG